MRDSTKKLSGPQKDKFFERLFASEEGISESAAASLLRRTSYAVSSVHVRAKAYEAVRQAKPAMTRQAREPHAPVAVPAQAAAPASRSVEEKSVVPAPAAPVAKVQASTAAAAPSAPFDPYAFGLVPLYQKEGRESFLAKLATVATADQLRQMARAQQVSLPLELRSVDATLDALRTGIADAVAKRIADRKAAAG